MLQCIKRNDDLKFYLLFMFQETGPWIHEVLLTQFHMEFLPVVLFRWRAVWICQFPHVRIESLETNVS